MLHINQLMAATLLVSSAVVAQAGNLWVVGDATPSKWSLDDATAIVSRPESQVYTGTLYLTANKDFKFLTTTDFGNEEIGAAAGATLTDGKIQLAKGTNDEGYGKIQVPEDGNYYMSVDLDTMEAEIVKSEYQDTHINLCSLFMVGSATPGEWSVDAGTPLYQSINTPYVYSSTVALKAGTFKIATVIKGGGSFDAKYFYFKDANDANKMVLGQTDPNDSQWSIEEDGTYTVAANTLTNSISIKKEINSGVAAIATDNAPAVYYTLDGVKVNNPAKGLYIVKHGSKVSKVILK